MFGNAAGGAEQVRYFDRIFLAMLAIATNGFIQRRSCIAVIAGDELIFRMRKRRPNFLIWRAAAGYAILPRLLRVFQRLSDDNDLAVVLLCGNCWNGGRDKQ